MTKHFVVFPSADASDRGYLCSGLWIRKGYRVLLGYDSKPEGAFLSWDKDWGDKFITSPVKHDWPAPFLGYYRVINDLVTSAFAAGADLVTCIGDDMDPPTQGADEHSRLYFARFPNGEGVMQCTGDRQGIDDSGRAAAERICGSPTFGKGWAFEAHKSRGPFWDGYKSFFGDEDLLNVASKLDLLYQEPALSIFHRHWSWGHRACEAYNERAQANWEADKALFEERKKLGFPDD